MGRSNRIDANGNKFITVPAITWYTNLPRKQELNFIDLKEKYCVEKHVEYDNYNAINVDKTLDIPYDYYDGVMGVPITFMDKYNPEQFEILGLDSDVASGKLSYLRKDNWQGKFGRGVINGQTKYARILIKHKRRDKNVES